MSSEARTCSVPGCEGKLYARGLCCLCYWLARDGFCEVCDKLSEVPCPACGRAA